MKNIKPTKAMVKAAKSLNEGKTLPRSLGAAADPFVYDGKVSKKTISEMNAFAKRERKSGQWVTVKREPC